MDVTNENFMQHLPEITETIQGCDFIAIDTELSGLMRHQSHNRFDLPEERFAKFIESSRGYFIMQFGLSCFTQINDLHYTNKTYNFYIFPQQNKFHGDINRTFSIQAHAIQFLSEHEFDFNKLFKHGVSYLTFKEKRLLTAQLKEDSKARSKVEFDEHGVPDFVPLAMSNYIRDTIKKINKFVESREVHKVANSDMVVEANSNMSISTNQSDDQEMVDDSMTSSPEDRLELKDCNTRHRLGVMKRVIECLPSADNLQSSEISADDETYLVVDYMNKNVKIDRLKKALIKSKGFLEIIELIIVNKKPIVGHNLSLDLIQIINQFMDSLSDDYSSFKDTCQSLFPLIYDTKYIAHSILEAKTLAHNQSRLNDLYCQLKESTSFPKLKVEHTGVTFDENQLAHQAGYDAYMSGFSFIVLCEAYVKSNTSKKQKHKTADGNKPPTISHHKLVLDEFSNRIHLSYSYDFKYFDLSREEPEPDRDHVFYLEFPSTWSLDDLFQMFQQHGGAEVSRLSKTSALCALRDRKQTEEIMKKVKNGKRANYKIFTYESYLENYKTKRPSNDDSGDVMFSAA